MSSNVGNVTAAVSVVISTTDRADSLRRTLRSLEQLDYPNLEVVVVRGPCEDHTDDVLAEFEGRIKIGICPRLNLSESRNLGIRMAAGEYVAFIDDDAYPDPAWLDRLLTGFAHWDTASVGGVVLDHSGIAAQTRQLAADRFGNWARLGPTPAEYLSFPGTPLAPYAMGTNGIYRRRFLVEIGGFDENFEYHLDEAEVCRRLVERGYIVAYVDDAVVYHKALQSRRRTEQRALRNYYSIFKSKVLFALQHGMPAASFAEVTRDLTAYVERHRAWVQDSVARGLLDSSALDAFDDDARQAFDVAWLQHLSGDTGKTRPPGWFQEQADAFLPFPIRRPREDRLHVCLLTDEYLPAQLNGIARTVHTLATGLAERGHVVRVLTAGDEPGSVDLEDGIWVHRVAIRQQDAPAGFPDEQLWAYSASLRRELERIDEHRPIDIVQAPNWGGLGAAVLGDERFTTVLSLHTPLKTVADMDQSLRNGDRPRDDIQRLIEIERDLYGKPDGYLASSPSIVDEVQEQYAVLLEKDRTGVVGHGLPDRTRQVRPQAHGPGVEVLFVGRLEPRKGIDTLLECFPRLADEFPDLRFTVIGNDAIKGPSGATYRELYERSEAGRRLRDRIRFTGVVEEDELALRYAGCDIFVAPSRYESFGLILLEAMMFGKPVVACDVGGMARIVEHERNGLLVPPGDASALREAIARLVRSRELRLEYGRRSRTLFEERYSAERMVTETNLFYDRLLGRRTAGRPVVAAGVGIAGEPAQVQAAGNSAVATQTPEDGDKRPWTTGHHTVREVARHPAPEAPDAQASDHLPPLTESMVCPACRTSLRLISAVVAGGRTKTGQLICDRCQRVACAIDHFKYDFLVDDIRPLRGVKTRDVGVLGERRVPWSYGGIKYGRGWHPTGDGFMTSTGSSGDSLIFTGMFTDAQVRFLRHPHGGIVDVFLDDELAATADLFMPIASQEVAIPVAADLPLSEHTILVMARGTKHPESADRRVPFEEIVMFGPPNANMGFSAPGPLNRGNGYPEVVERWVAATPANEWILECGGGDRRLGAPNVVNFEYLKYELADVYGDAHNMPFQDGTFGLVFTQAVFEHLRNPFDVARELVRVTRPGGFIVTEVAFLQPLHAAPYHYFNMTHWGVEELFSDCTVVERGWQGSLEFIVDWLMRSVNLDTKIDPAHFERISREFHDLDALVSHEELKPAASGVWVVVRKDA